MMVFTDRFSHLQMQIGLIERSTTLYSFEFNYGLIVILFEDCCRVRIAVWLCMQGNFMRSYRDGCEKRFVDAIHNFFIFLKKDGNMTLWFREERLIISIQQCDYVWAWDIEIITQLLLWSNSLQFHSMGLRMQMICKWKLVGWVFRHFNVCYSKLALKLKLSNLHMISIIFKWD